MLGTIAGANISYKPATLLVWSGNSQYKPKFYLVVSNKNIINGRCDEYLYSTHKGKFVSYGRYSIFEWILADDFCKST
jgi:hypothetical protein